MGVGSSVLSVWQLPASKAPANLAEYQVAYAPNGDRAKRRRGAVRVAIKGNLWEG